MFPEEDLHVQVTAGTWGWGTQFGQFWNTSDTQVGAGRDAGEAGLQPEGPELVEEEADLQISVPGRVSTGSWGGWSSPAS